MVSKEMKNRLIYIDFLRVYLCVAIFLYHLDVLKGGYLAVCSFFVLSGYLSAQSLKKEKFSLMSYYKSRFIRVYIPMILVVFVSLAACMFFMPDMIWVSMKREVASIVFCKNNFWQLSANMDYFARHVDSPYMHLWYVAILLQLEFVFPLIYAVLRFLKNKLGVLLPVLLCGVATTVSMSWFICVHMLDGLMPAYYDTLTRCFSWFAGIAVGLIHLDYVSEEDEKTKGKIFAKIFLYILVIGQGVLFVMASAESKLYLGSMIGTTFVMCVMLACARVINNKMPSIVKGIIGFFSDISYEIFLVQYPVIYIFQGLDMPMELKYALIVAITIVAAALLNLALHPNKKPLFIKIVAIMLLLCFIGGAGYGVYRYVVAPDLQAEMERLEAEMERQREEQERKQREYEEQLRQEEEQKKKEEEERLEELEEEEADLDDQIWNLKEDIDEMEKTVAKKKITFVGDSVLLGASDVLYEVFTKCYIDADLNRTGYVLNPILVDLKERGILGDIVVINCGSNGDCSTECKDDIMETLSDRQVFWVNTSNNKWVNENLVEYAEGVDNLHIIDWAAASEGHGEYFDGDGIHLNWTGKDAYAQVVMDAICDYYIEDLEAEIAELEAQMLEIENQKEELEEE